MYKVVLLRHGESVWNKENLFTGWTDVDLSEKGNDEAHEAGRILKEKGFVFTTILVKPKIAVRSEEERAKALELLHKSESACLISNSIKSEVTIEPEVVVV